jgi:hypothetical protein
MRFKNISTCLNLANFMTKETIHKQTKENDHPLRILFRSGRLLGILPLERNNSNNIQFRIKSWAFVHYAFIWTVNVLVLISSLHHWFYNDLQSFLISNLPFFITTYKLLKHLHYLSVGCVYYFNIVFAISSFFYFSKKWPSILELWHVSDTKMNQRYGHLKNIKTITVIYFIIKIGTGGWKYMTNLINLWRFLGSDIISHSQPIKIYIDKYKKFDLIDYMLEQQRLGFPHVPYNIVFATILFVR